jgi:carboxyl-terminal processing protease
MKKIQLSVRAAFACLALLAVVPGAAVARPLQCGDLSDLFKYYLRHHYQHGKMTDAIRTRTVDQFIKLLDPAKVYFLDGDVTVLRKDLGNVFGETEKSNCASLDKAQQLMIQRLTESKAFVEQFLGPSYKFDDTAELVINPDQRGYAKTADERNAYLGKQTHFQVSNYLMTDVKLEEAKRLIRKRYELTLKRVNDRKANEVMDLWAEAFSRALDPHSSYMSQDTLEDFQIQMQLSLEGIGASLTSDDGYTVVEELIPGGAADKDKQLKPKDKITAVAQDPKDVKKAAAASPNPKDPKDPKKPSDQLEWVDVMDWDLRDVVKLIRGKKGTKVHLSILRQGEKTESFKVTLVRDKVDLKEQAAKITYEKRKVDGQEYKLGIIDLPSFYGGGKGEGRSCYQDVKDLLHQAKVAKVDGIILDLSRNGGGLLDQAVQIGGLFIKKGGIVATKSSDGRVEVLDDEDPGTYYSGPLAVLTSRLSASASEILAGALKDYHRAVIIGGDHSFGKGTVQVLAPLPDSLGAMKVTTGMFFIPSGLSTQHLGVASDIQLPSPLNSDEYGEKKLDYSLDQQKIDGFVSKDALAADPAQRWAPVDPGTISKLNAKAQARVAKSEKFAQIKKEMEETLRNKGTIKLAEIRKKASEDKKNGKKEKKKKAKKFDSDEDGPFLQESTNILVDLIVAQNPKIAKAAPATPPTQ